LTHIDSTFTLIRGLKEFISAPRGSAHLRQLDMNQLLQIAKG
jgi:hypothetical protein